MVQVSSLTGNTFAHGAEVFSLPRLGFFLIYKQSGNKNFISLWKAGRLSDEILYRLHSGL
jgi:hypothetical protein